VSGTHTYAAVGQDTVTVTLSDDTPGTATATATSTAKVTQSLDHWINSAGGLWATASNWSNGVPGAGVTAEIDAIGTYTVVISTPATADSLIVNDAGATVSDGATDRGGVTGGLTLLGTGGTNNPNGALTINAGTFALTGGALAAGSILIAVGGSLSISRAYTGSNAFAESIVDNGSLVITDSKTSVTLVGPLSGSGAVFVENGANATFGGSISGSANFNIETSSSALIATAVSGTGSFALFDKSNLEFAAADSEAVTFMPGTTGTLTLDHATSGAFTGTIAGLTSKNAVDLADLAWVKKQMSASFTGTTAGGVLIVSDGSQSVSLKLVGDYTHSSWTLSKDKSGGTNVSDPLVSGSLATGGIDLPDISFGADTTVGYAADSGKTGGTLTASDGVYAQSLSLLGQYMASSFATSSDGHGGTLITDQSLTTVQTVLTQPQH
jgi:hypothetical protein